MVFKINIGTKEGKTYKLEVENEDIVGKQLHEIIEGKELNPELIGYEFEITGASDNAGFPAMEEVEGVALKKILLNYGKGMKKRPKYEGKKKRTKNRPKGLRLRKTVRGKVISPNTIQLNLKIIKEGAKSLAEIFADQNAPKEKENRKTKRAKAKEETKKPVESAQEKSETSEEKQ
jgi:small subunit ribosomal protein S6e